MSADHDLRLGDCLAPDGLASLADKSVDHVICDPPFEAEAHTKQSSVRGKQGLARGDNGGPALLSFGAISEDTRSAVAVQMARVARRWVIVFCQAEAVAAWRAALEAAGLVYMRACVWVKPDGLPQMSGDRPAQGYESMVCAHAPVRPRWNGGGKHGVYTFNKNDADNLTGHPTKKPIDLMLALVRDFTDPGELICDPFTGSGTTLVAAKRLGRRAIGWERDPKFHAAAVKRIEGAAQQYEFAPRLAKPKQGKLGGV